MKSFERPKAWMVEDLGSLPRGEKRRISERGVVETGYRRSVLDREVMNIQGLCVCNQ